MQFLKGWPVSTGRTLVLLQALTLLVAGWDSHGRRVEVRDAYNTRQFENSCDERTTATPTPAPSLMPAPIPILTASSTLNPSESGTTSISVSISEGDLSESTPTEPELESSSELMQSGETISSETLHQPSKRPTELPGISTEPINTSPKPGKTLSETNASDTKTIAPPNEALIISVEVIDNDGNPDMVPVIVGGAAEAITLDPITTTATGEEAEATIAEVQERLRNLESITNEWEEDPEANKERTLSQIDEVQASVLGAIGGLGAVGTTPAVSRLAGIAQLMGAISSAVAAGAAGVPVVGSAVSTIFSTAGNLQSGGGGGGGGDRGGQDGNDVDDGDDSADQTSISETTTSAEASSSSSSSRRETTTEAPIESTPSPTSSSSSSIDENTLCAPGRCGDACLGAPGRGLSHSLVPTGAFQCSAISTTTTLQLPTESFGNIGAQTFDEPPERETPSLPEAPDVGDEEREVTNGAWGAMDMSASHDARSLNVSSPLRSRALPDVANDARSRAIYVTGLDPVYINQGVPSSAEWFDFPRYGHSAAGVNGIYGCTSVMIISNKGVYISHIWEIPVFQRQRSNGQYVTTSDETFRQNAFRDLRDGSASALSFMTLIGSDQNPGPLHRNHVPRVFVITPYTTEFDRVHTGVTTRYRYESRARRLGHWVSEAIPGAEEATVIGYVRTDQETSTGHGFAGRAIVEVDPFQYWLTSPQDPRSAGLQIGRWRIWVENHNILYQDYFTPPAWPRRLAKRQDDGEDNEVEEVDELGHPNPCQAPLTPSPTAADITTTITEHLTTLPDETTTAFDATIADPEETSTFKRPTTTDATTAEASITTFEHFTYTEVPNEWGPSYIVVCKDNAMETGFDMEGCNGPSETVSTIEPERTGDTEKCRFEGHVANYWDCFLFLWCDLSGGVAEANLFIPAEDGDTVWGSDRVRVEKPDDGPVHKLDYGEAGVQESIEYTWAFEGDYCACAIDGKQMVGEFSTFGDYDDEHLLCTCDFNCHRV